LLSIYGILHKFLHIDRLHIKHEYCKGKKVTKILIRGYIIERFVYVTPFWTKFKSANTW